MNYLEELKGSFLAGAFPGMLQGNRNRSKYLGPYENTTQTLALFDVKVLYVKVTGCSIDETPESLRVCLPPRSIETALELNGGRISPSEEACLTLRRDRLNPVEVTYVSTDHLRLLGTVNFVVNDGDEMVVCGVIDKSPGSNEGQDSGWSIECSCGVGSTGCVFLKSRGDLGAPPSALEICVVGQYAGSPLVLTQTLPLTARRRVPRGLMLDAIPEDDENKLVRRLEQDLNEESAEDHGPKPGFYAAQGMSYVENDDGEMTWFNAGVRVGVGIGLGMCLGIGIGVGLLIRTYQATTRTFRRNLF